MSPSPFFDDCWPPLPRNRKHLLASPFDVDDLLRRVRGEDDGPVFGDEDFVLLEGERRKGRTEPSGGSGGGGVKKGGVK